jgi:hydrogenase expression/formation protein HypD
MKYLDEYRDPVLARKLMAEIHRVTTRPWTLMEVCGGQTHTIVKQGIDELLPEGVRMIHGPGCPVCVTPLEQVDKALAIAARPDVIFTSYGDMLRVPGSTTDLLALKARGADVRIVYSPLDALKVALANADKQVVFFAVGFETTAPANAMAVWQASQLGIDNFSILVSHVLVPPAMTALLESPSNQVQGFLAAGHVCAVMGWTEYEPIAAKYRVPIVVTGFEPLDLLEGILMAIKQLEEGRAEVENQYVRAVRREGNRLAQETVFRVFDIGERKWRGIGEIPSSGYRLKPAFARFDAEAKFDVGSITTQEHPACIAGAILTGEKTPLDCTAYGTLCHPQKPLGAPMVSSEGTCAAFYAAGRGITQGIGAPARPLEMVSPAGEVAR